MHRVLVLGDTVAAVVALSDGIVLFWTHSSPAPAEISQPPFEVTETGWGEFEIAIKIFFHDPSQPPVTAVHLLKLHPAPHTQASVHKVRHGT